jgi:hypothetical protein
LFADRLQGAITQLAIVTSMVSRFLPRERQFVAHHNAATSRIANLADAGAQAIALGLQRDSPVLNIAAKGKPDASFQHGLMRRYFFRRNRFRIPVCS